MSLVKDFQPGKGTKWEISEDDMAYTEITGVRSHAIPAQNHEQIEFTGNEDDGEEFVSSPLEMSDVFTLDINYKPGNAGHEELITANGKQRYFRVTTQKIIAGAAAADGYVYTFRANIAGITFPPYSNNEAARMSVSVRPCGPISRAAAA